MQSIYQLEMRFWFIEGKCDYFFFEIEKSLNVKN